VIVTFNLAHFPASALQYYGIEAQHPDRFITHLMDLAPLVVYSAVKRQRQAMKNPPTTAEELLDTLERQQLEQTVARLRTAVDLL
jgi:hypothetical protein